MKPVLDFFLDITDPRVERTKLHPLSDIIGITLCATLAGAKGWDEIHIFADARNEWLQDKLGLSLASGAPSADTIRRVISRIDSGEFRSSFQVWINEIAGNITGVVSIDGKTVKNKFDPSPIHIVSAWTKENGGLCLAQVKTDDKSNEITAIPSLLDFLDLKGCIVTIDAMGCQKEIARKIVEENDSNFCLAVKGNQPTLHSDLQYYFSECDGYQVEGADYSCLAERNRGREEVRVAYSCSETSAIPPLKEWPWVKSFGGILAERNCNGTISSERRYYISSKTLSAKELNDTVRDHWGIENQLHFRLDVAFCEDGNRIAKDNGQENLSMVRKISLTLFDHDKSKISTKRKIFKAGLSESYMAKILQL